MDNMQIKCADLLRKGAICHLRQVVSPSIPYTFCRQQSIYAVFTALSV